MVIIGKDIQVASEILERGELVAIPTETVYGLAANAWDTDAVLRIFSVKNRPQFNPLIVHCGDLEQLKSCVKDFPLLAQALAELYMPGPLTLLLPKAAHIPDLVTAGSERVAVRIPAHALTLELLQNLSFPLAAPSANPFGYISPTCPEHVAQQLGDKIPYILDGGASEVGLESTIVGWNEEGETCIYRVGGLSVEEIEKVVGKVKLLTHSEAKPTTSGQMLSHYAPDTPLILGDLKTLLETYGYEKTATLSLNQQFEELDPALQLTLSESGDLDEAAKNLFAALRKLDTLDARVILAEEMPEEGLGRAINDRLRRAQFTMKWVADA